jgi:hypothetical protein
VTATGIIGRGKRAAKYPHRTTTISKKKKKKKKETKILSEISIVPVLRNPSLEAETADKFTRMQLVREQ